MEPSNLSNKLIAEYSELANQYLDEIPVENLQDFETIQVALSALLSEEKSFQEEEFSPLIRGRN